MSVHAQLVRNDKTQFTELLMFWKDAGFCVSAQFLNNEILNTENFPFFFFFFSEGSMAVKVKVTQGCKEVS